MEIGSDEWKPTLRLFDDFVDNIKSSADFHLSCQLNSNSLAYCLLDQDQNKYIGLEQFQWNHPLESNLDACLSIIKKSLNQVNEAIKLVDFSIVNRRSTLVPSALFNKEKMEKYFHFNLEQKPDEIIMFDYLKNIDAYNIYGILKPELELIRSRFPGVQIRHYSSCLLETLFSLSKNKTGKQVIVHIQPTHFDIIIFGKQKLNFFNSFPHETSEDFIYYLLYTFEQLKINPENVVLKLLGEIEKDSALYSALRTYVRNIEFGTRPQGFDYHYQIKDLPNHYYYNLFSQHLCV